MSEQYSHCKIFLSNQTKTFHIPIQAINGHLQGRMRPLDIDDHLPEVSPINQSTEAFSHLTAALNIHLIIDQLLTINTPSMIISLKKTSIQWISNQSFEQIENSRIVFPVHFTSENLSDDTRITFRVCSDCSIFLISSL